MELLLKRSDRAMNNEKESSGEQLSIFIALIFLVFRIEMSKTLHKCRTALTFTYCRNKFGIDGPSSIIVLAHRVLAAKAEKPGQMISFSKLRVPIGLDWTGGAN